MQIGLFVVIFSNEKFEAALDRAVKMGVEAVEIGTGNYPGNAHCKPGELLKSKDAQQRLLAAVRSRGLEISALSCHGNMVHPNPRIATAHHQVFEQTLRLAEKLGVDTVVNFSGTPGGAPGDKTPNWITCPWPNDFSDALKWQWEQKLIPYWQKMSKMAASCGVKIALEMHPGMSVYHTESLLRLRRA
jgi:sugar phosphate isomerase/epimerase